MPIELAAGNRAPWRAMEAADLPAVHALSLRVHPDHPERAEVLAEKLRLFPGGCFVSVRTGSICGYCFSHPWRDGGPPALDRLLGELPARPSVYFIHDLTLDEALRGRGLGRALVATLLAVAREAGFDRVMLVAVAGRAPFWSAAGFAAIADEAVQAEARKKYGLGALAMARPTGGS